MLCSLAVLIGEVIPVETERSQHRHIEMESPSARGEPAQALLAERVRMRLQSAVESVPGKRCTRQCEFGETSQKSGWGK